MATALSAMTDMSMPPTRSIRGVYSPIARRIAAPLSPGTILDSAMTTPTTKSRTMSTMSRSMSDTSESEEPTNRNATITRNPTTHATAFQVVGFSSPSPLARPRMSGIWYRIRAAKKNIIGISQFCSSASMPTAHTRSPMTTPMPRGTMKRRSLRSFPLMSAMSAMSLSYTPDVPSATPI